MKKFFATFIALIVMTTAFASVLASSYICNANTKKFHYADCSAVNKMNPANKVYMDTREEAIAAGYIPCKRCNP